MAYKLVILPEAVLDINEAAVWYEEKQKGLGKRFISAIKHEMPVIRQNPLKYIVRYDDVRTALTKTFPYLIHFTIEDTTIIVKAVYHTSRNSEIWNDL